MGEHSLRARSTRTIWWTQRKRYRPGVGSSWSEGLVQFANFVLEEVVDGSYYGRSTNEWQEGRSTESDSSQQQVSTTT